jgi:tripartite-type tricarboxylate transporter receptor subunit TctC
MKPTILRTLMTPVLAALALVSSTSIAAADAFPSRPVRIVVNVAPGGLTDIVTRLVGQKMSENLGQPVIVENKAGADGLLGIRFVKTAPADGYTLLATAGTIAIQPAIKQDPGYDLSRDFTGLGPMARSPVLMVEATSQPDRTLADFIARAKANPDKLSYASAGVGTTTHVGAALFLQQAGLKLLHVPYKGNGAAMADVMAGRVNMIFEAAGSGASKVRAGQLRALGVTSTKRLPAFPEIPTIAEQGVAGFSYYLWLGLLAPAGTPKDVLHRLSQALHSALNSKELKDRMRDDGTEPMIMSPEEYSEFLKRDLARMASLISDLGIPKQ